MGKKYTARTARSVQEIATVVKRTAEDPSVLGFALRANVALHGNELRWESVPTDSWDHFSFGVMNTEPDWSVRYVWQAAKNPGWWTIDFIVNEAHDQRNVSITVDGAALVSKRVPHSIAERVLAQL